MIHFLDGTIEYKKDKFAVINVGGVGYKVFAGADVLARLPAIGEKARIFAHLHVREDAMELYGFLEQTDLAFFEMVIGISGVGPKMALAIMSVAPSQMLASAIAREDISFLTRVSGVGKKTAEKIILELKDKIHKIGIELEGVQTGDNEALDALESLGYSPREAQSALQKISKDVKGVENRIKEALRILGRK